MTSRTRPSSGSLFCSCVNEMAKRSLAPFLASSARHAAIPSSARASIVQSNFARPPLSLTDDRRRPFTPGRALRAGGFENDNLIDLIMVASEVCAVLKAILGTHCLIRKEKTREDDEPHVAA